MVAYAELAVTTNFSFLRGASHPQEMVAQADALGLAAIGISDRNSLAGVVRAYDKWRKIRNEKQAGEKTVKLLVGTRLVTIDGFEVLTYPKDRTAYGELSKLITRGNRLLDGKKAECHLTFEDILSVHHGQIFIAIPPGEISLLFEQRLETLAQAARGRTYLAGTHLYRGDDIRRLGLLSELGERTGAPLVAINDVHYHAPHRRALADVVTCVREKCTILDAGFRLAANAEQHLKSPRDMAYLFRHHPEAIERTIAIADVCQFTLEDLKNEYPDEPVPPGKTPQQHLEDLTWAGAERRYPKNYYPEGVPLKVQKIIREELALIQKMDYARYFITVHDVVAFARTKDILCQGRGSAANSAVCYCLWITEINPETSNLLFARFISENRGEPPDIDVDFEHDRREEVMQYVYERYGRHRAAICATVIHYRSRRAIREVGKALGLTPDITAALSKTVWGSHSDGLPDKHIRQAGLDPSNRALMQAVLLARELIGFPRHLSQHVGGFILTRGRLDETVPIGNGAMEKRTFIEWDKDDIDVLGLMKVDVLALGMLSCLRRGLDLMKDHYGKDFTLATLPKDDHASSKPVYDMLSKADSVGVFQVESRAQMSMLPRLKPQEFYDLVIEVAIVRPGPIQGDMVHPYLRRRDGIEPEYYPSPLPEYGEADELKEVLKRTKGVPLFQEQAMQIAITAAEFTPDEADGLRRAMATFRHTGNVPLFREKFISRMTKRGYDPTFVENCFGQIEGFGEYGFPESHAASFALLVYASAWIKCHYPEVFCAAILNSQPMGFYQPAQLIRDAREHGVEVKPVDVNHSDWDCTLEHPSGGGERLAVRLGFRQIQGLNEDELKNLVAARGNGFSSVERLAAVAGVSRFTIERLAAADAFRSLDLDRRAALWAARRLDTIGIRKPMERKAHKKDTTSPLPLLAPHMSEELFPEPQIELPLMPLSEHVAEDYVATGLSLKAHPISFFRDRLRRIGAITTAEHRSESLPQNKRVMVAGLVLIRQMPGTAKGVVFLTIEDETGIANIIVWRKVFEKHRRIVMNSKFLAVRGRLQRAGLVIHVVAEDFRDLSNSLRDLKDAELPPGDQRSAEPHPQNPTLLKSRDFH